MIRAAEVTLLVVALAVVPVTATREHAEVTPVQKVIQLIEGMVAKGKKEENAEMVQFAAYKQFCSDTQGQKQTAIKEANEQIEVLKADIEQADANAADLGEQIAKHDEDISCWEGDLKASTKVREIENEGYILTHKDYTESIQAIEDGIATLQNQNHDVEQAAALLQLSSLKMPAETQRAIDAYLHSDPEADENLAEAAPEAHAAVFHSQGLVDMLSKLQAKFIDERDELEKMETEAKQSYEMLTMDLKSQIDKGTAARTEKQAAKGKALQDSADATGAKTDTTTTRDDDTKYLSDLTAECEQKSAAFAERQTLRAEEIEAVMKAAEILSSGAVSGAADKHLPALAQLKSSLAQLRVEMRNPTQLRVAAFLRMQAERINSRVLTALAVRVSDDPFKKVKKMIKDMIVKLMEEANAEAEQKGWCDTEMASNEQTRTEKAEAVETLHAEIDELTGSIAQLTQEITELTQGVADISTAVEQATTAREEEKAKNAVTVKDAQEAQTAVAQAVAVLKDFYDKAAQATSFVQQKPAIFDEPYKGMGAENGGVLGMIEVIASDFARLESETTSAESEGQKGYEEFMADSEVDKAQKQSDIEHKKSKKQNQEQELEEKKTDLDGTQKELETALAYYDKLKPSCVDAGVSYEDRVARRKEEIESLQEALKILTGE